MNYILIYSRLSRLNFSNKNLLALYHTLKEIEDEDEELIDVLKQRIDIRNSFNEEFQGLLNEIRAKRTIFASAVCSIFFNTIGLYSKVNKLFISTTYNTCTNCELHNVNQYYNTIYSLRSHERLIEILLRQKNQIEDYLMEEL